METVLPGKHARPRSGRLQEVLLNAVGGIIGIVIAVLLVVGLVKVGQFLLRPDACERTYGEGWMLDMHRDGPDTCKFLPTGGQAPYPD